jgi:hypothetical protein
MKRCIDEVFTESIPTELSKRTFGDGYCTYFQENINVFYPIQVIIDFVKKPSIPAFLVIVDLLKMESNR